MHVPYGAFSINKEFEFEFRPDIKISLFADGLPIRRRGGGYR